MLRSWAEDQGHRFLDYEQDVLDPQTMLEREELRNRNPEDHHLEAEMLARMLATALNRIGFE